MSVTAPPRDDLSLENATKRQLIDWYCQIKAGDWPPDFPYAMPAEWYSMTEEQRYAIPAVIDLKKVTTSRVKSKDLALIYHVLGYNGSSMTSDEFIDYWQNGAWESWGTRMAA